MFIFWYLELNIFLKIYLHAFWHFCVRTMQRNKSYLKIGEFIFLYVRKGQTSEIVFVVNTPNGWLFTNKVYHLLLLMNKLGRETNELESLDIKREDGHQPNKKKLHHQLIITFSGRSLWDLWEDYTDKPSFSHNEKNSQTEHELVTLKKRKQFKTILLYGSKRIPLDC